MTDGGNGFDNPQGKSAGPFDERRVDITPREIEIPTDQTLRVPSVILGQVSEEQRKSKYSVYVRLDLATIADPNLPAAEKEKLNAAPYEIAASDKFIFVSFSTIKNPDYPHANLQILRLGYDQTTGVITKVFRDADDSMFKIAMADFPAGTLLGRVKEAIRTTPPSEMDRRKYGAIVAESDKVRSLSDELQAKATPNFLSETLREDEVNRSYIKTVEQAEYTVASDQQTEWLATHGAADCFIISIYDPVHKRGALTHIDALTDAVATVENMRYELAHAREVGETSPYRITISGGTLGSVAAVTRTYDVIKKWQQEQGIPLDIGVGNLFTGRSESLALNLKDGKITRFIPLPQPGNENSLLGLLQMQGRALEASINGKRPAKRV